MTEVRLPDLEQENQPEYTYDPQLVPRLKM